MEDDSKEAVEEGRGVKMPLDQKDFVTKPTVMVMLRNINLNMLNLLKRTDKIVELLEMQAFGQAKSDYDAYELNRKAAEAEKLATQRDKERKDREAKKGNS